jgi:hypothetical protein
VGFTHHPRVTPELDRLFAAQGEIATSWQIHNPLAESPMESEARLAMHDGGLPEPVLQYEIIDLEGQLWRVDFAWPDEMVAVEYDGFDWHSSPAALQRDRQKRAALEEMGWRVMSIVGDDVRRRPNVMVRRIAGYFGRRAAA